MTVVINDLHAVEDGEEGDEKSAVPVVRDSSPVVALASQVRQCVQGEVLVFVQEHLQQGVGAETGPMVGVSGYTDLLLFHADPQVRLVELVGDVPAQGSELPPLLHHGVEEAEPKEELPPGLGLG